MASTKAWYAALGDAPEASSSAARRWLGNSSIESACRSMDLPYHFTCLDGEDYIMYLFKSGCYHLIILYQSVV